MSFSWPEGFERVPSEEWTGLPLESLALKYDTVENHGWYRNLDLTVAQLVEYVQDEHVLLDYSGGTGILAERLLREIPEGRFGILIVDSSPKFLRLALEKFGDNERMAFRLLRYLKQAKRLQLVQEVCDASLLDRGVDAVVSTNAIHLYYDLEDTLRSWASILRPGRRVFLQSGNIGNPDAAPGDWIIDETVDAIHRAAVEIVRTDERYVAYRRAVGNVDRMRAHEHLRRKFFLPVRPLGYYLKALGKAGFIEPEVTYRAVEAAVEDWREFLGVYSEGVIGWVGGSAQVEGKPPSDKALRDRMELMRHAMTKVFGGRETFRAGWTYITCRTAGRT